MRDRGGSEQRGIVVASRDFARAAQWADRVAAVLEPLDGLPLGTYDRRMVEWLAGFDVPTVGGVVSLLYRARAARPLGRRS